MSAFGHPLDRFLFEGAPPPPAHLAALGLRFVNAATPRFRNFRVDLEAVQSAAVAASERGEIAGDDAMQLFVDHGDSVSLPMVRRYIEACETELVARWLMALGSFHFPGWATPRNRTALAGMIAAGEEALAVRLVRKHLEKTHKRAKSRWLAVARKRPAVIPADLVERYETQMAKARWELPGELETARLEVAELEDVVRDHGSHEDNRAIDAMIDELAKVRARFNLG